MTTLNTIIEEEKKAIESYDSTLVDSEDSSYRVFHIPERDLLTIFTTAMQRAYEAGQSEERAKTLMELREAFIERGADRGSDTILWDGPQIVGVVDAVLAKLTPDKPDDQ